MRFNLLALVVSFAVGIVYMMMTVPRPRMVVKFPTPDRSGMDVYQSKAGSCYKVEAERVTCPENGDKVRPQPVADLEEVDHDSAWTTFSPSS